MTGWPEGRDSEEVIRTRRLDLILFRRETLRDLLSGRTSSIEGVALPAGWVARSERTLRRRLGQVTGDPSSARWLLRAMVLRDTKEFVGRIGFHGRVGTNAVDAPDALELGYAVEPAFRRQGLAEEAIRGMIDWAQQRSISHFVVSIGPGNEPSLALAAKLGFKEVARVIDEDGDGPEIVFALEAGA